MTKHMEEKERTKKERGNKRAPEDSHPFQHVLVAHRGLGSGTNF